MDAGIFERLPPELLLVIVALGFVLNFAMQLVKVALDRKDRGRIVTAAEGSCSYPADLAQVTREAIQRSAIGIEAQRAASERLDGSFGRLTGALERHTEKLTELVAEVKARQ